MMLSLLSAARRQPQQYLRPSVASATLVPLARSFGNRQAFPPNTYAGPYTEEEVHKLEQFAVQLKSEAVDQKLVNPWLRAKLGPYFREGWTDRVAARKFKAEREARHAQRPGDSTHFTVKHDTGAEQPEAEGKPKMFAVVGLAGTQFKVVEGDVIVCNRLPTAEVGTSIELTDILMVGFPHETHVGRPNVPGWFVRAHVEQQAREKKSLSFYKQPKTFSQKMRGYRREVTILRIGEICQVASLSGEEGKKE